ncbi:MAG: GAF domain-containing sensor histidine kinase [Armatimonadetes bacterium]|nr:GAF domain-containing sensor histidine kinase [Armatimonadota bacterium]HOM82807.1 GAF domain-containing sensor histidine kinase [Armatimonadota bacterium]HPO74253.1 GAF domain-containing sensor histidine kinase [Armatimonadota bacterium]
MVTKHDGSPYEEEIARLRAALAERQRQIDAVHRISQALYTKTKLDDLLRETLQVSLETLDANSGSLYTHDPEKHELVFAYVIAEPEVAAVLTGRRMPDTQGIAGEVFQSGIPKITDDVAKEARHYREVDRESGYVTRNMITVPLKAAEGKPIGVMQVLNKASGVFSKQDLEVLTILGQQAATAIENARLHEEARLAEVVKLMGDISHDIKNMITPVVTCSQTLELLFQQLFMDLDQIYARHEKEHPELIQEVQQAVDFLRSFYPEAIEMFNDGAIATQERVREIADCVKGIIAQPRFELVDVNDVVARVIKPLSLVAEKAGVALTHERGEVALTLVDQKQLYNAVYNLVNNAIPETPAGGSVTIRTYDGPEGEFPDGGYVMIEVADTGRGMPEEVRKRLFTEDAVSTKPGGTGLGTKIVKNVVDVHQGRISVESELGKGTRFYMRLPIRTELPEADQSHAA